MKRKTIYTIAALLIAGVAAQAQDRVLTLPECKELARRNDPYERNAALDVLAARAQKQEALAEYFPSVSATAMAYHALHPFIDLGVTDILGTSDNAWNISNYLDQVAPQYGLPTRYKALQYGYGATVTLTQPVFAGGRIVNGNRLASLGIEAAELQQSLRHRDTELQVEQKYWLVVSLQEKKKTLEEALSLVSSLEKDVLAARAAGVLTDSDVMMVKLRSSELRSSELQLKGGTRLAKMDLFNALGIAYSTVEAMATPEKPFIDSIVMDDDFGGLRSPDSYYVPEEELADRMAETRLLALQVEAKDLQRKMTVGETLPEVGVGAMYGYGKAVGDGRMNGAVYAMVKIPISEWGKASRKIRRISYEVEKARNEQEYLGSQLLLRARQLWVNLTTAWEQLQVAEQSVEYARDVYERQRLSFETGLVTMSDLLQTQTSLRQSEDSYVEQCIAYRQALCEYQIR